MNVIILKAAVYEKFGPPEVIEIRDVEEPKLKSDEVLVKVHASTVSRGDVRMRSLDVPGNIITRFLARLWLGPVKPKRPILGMQIAGEIESVGNNVSKFKAGDQIFASTYGSGFGGHAEYKCIAEDEVITLKPTNMTYEEAATVPTPGLGAYSLLKKANIKSGQKVLVYGASGSVGTFAVQIAKAFGAEVTGMCSSSNSDMVKSLGATKVIDYTKEDFTQSGTTYAVIFDAVHKIPISQRKQSLNENGLYLSISQEEREKVEDLVHLKELIEEGKVKSVIDRTYSLEEIVEAHRYVDTGHKKGNVVITLNHS
jgi:NADPH:quinone reductase-like Zn-dependent oxidoreductase